MTNYNERLEEILNSFKLYLTLPGNVIGGSSQEEAKQAVLDWHNKQVEEALGRLGKDINICDGIKCMVAIEAERNKLKEATNDQL